MCPRPGGGGNDSDKTGTELVWSPVSSVGFWIRQDCAGSVHSGDACGGMEWGAWVLEAGGGATGGHGWCAG